MKVQRNTRQRQVILDELRKVTSHPTAAQLYDMVRPLLPRISLGTVYRNPDRLTETGVIQRVEVLGSEARYDGNAARHHHVRCVQCGRVGDLHSVPHDVLKVEVTEADGYEILGYRLEFFGRCPDCRKQAAANESPSSAS